MCESVRKQEERERTDLSSAGRCSRTLASALRGRDVRASGSARAMMDVAPSSHGDLPTFMFGTTVTSCTFLGLMLSQRHLRSDIHAGSHDMVG